MIGFLLIGRISNTTANGVHSRAEMLPNIGNLFKKDHGTMTVRLVDDIHTPMITGKEILPNDEIALCYHKNNRFKIV